MSKRDLFSELMQGVSEMAAHREGKMTLRNYRKKLPKAPVMTPQDIVELRQRLNMSQEVFAGRLIVKTDTLRNWERGKSKPNTQAVVLLKLVSDDPELLDKLSTIA